MTEQEYILSGLLELYIAGALTESESTEITKAVQASSQLAKEVESIEDTFCKIAMSQTPTLPENMFANIIQEINNSNNESLSLHSIKDNTLLISSGILELYVAGALTEEESIKISQLIADDADIQAEVERIEASYIQLSIADTPPLDEYGLADILVKIDHIEKQTAPTTNLLVSINNIVENNQESYGEKVGSFETKNFFREYGHYLAAAIIILMISAGANLFMMSELKKTSEQVAILDQDNVKAIDGMQTAYSSDRKNFMTHSSPSTLAIILMPTQKDITDIEATLYWDYQNGITHIDASKLPLSPKGKQWQVWAEISSNVTPYNLGLLSNMKTDQDNFFKLQMLNKEPKSFFVTLEPTGGSLLPSPNFIYLKATKRSENI